MMQDIGQGFMEDIYPREAEDCSSGFRVTMGVNSLFSRVNSA